MGPGHFGMGYGMGWIGMWIYPILMIALIIVVVYFIFGRRSDGRSSDSVGQNTGFTGGHSESALDLLKKRYAKGEISKEEFEQIKKDIL